MRALLLKLLLVQDKNDSGSGSNRLGDLELNLLGSLTTLLKADSTTDFLQEVSPKEMRFLFYSLFKLAHACIESRQVKEIEQMLSTLLTTVGR